MNDKITIEFTRDELQTLFAACRTMTIVFTSTISVEAEIEIAKLCKIQNRLLIARDQLKA